MTPTSKEEIYLAKLCGEDWELPYPASRLEYYYAKLCGMDVPLPAEPLSRPERYLAYLCGIDVNLPEPVSRQEMYMAKACGMDVKKLLEPLSKSERYWHLYIHHSQSLNTTLPAVINSSACHLINYRIYGNGIQNGSPSPEHPITFESVGTLSDNGYTIPVTCTGDNQTSLNTNIRLNQPLRKIGDYADYVDFEHQCVVREIKDLVLTGEESWNFREGTTGVNRFDLSFSPVSKGLSAHSVCTTFKYIASEAMDSVHFFNYRAAFFIYAAFNTLTDFKNWLAQQYLNGTPVVIYYVLDTSVSEPITLPEISTFDGTTTIDVTTAVKPSKMYIEYR